MRYFKQGESKEAIARPLIEAAKHGGKGQVVLLGIAQGKALVWRSWKAQGQEHLAHPHMKWEREMAYINHFYCYVWDLDWGPALEDQRLRALSGVAVPQRS